jgi:hypothetical protein
MPKTLMFVFAIILFFSRCLTTNEVPNGIPFPFRQLTCKFDEDCHDQASTFVEILKLHGKLLICEEGICQTISF